MKTTVTNQNYARPQDEIWALQKQFREDMEKLRESMQETDRRMQETDRRIQETDRMIKALHEENLRTEAYIKDTDRQLRENMNLLTTRFTSQAGHIIEGLMEPSTVKMFQDRGYAINRCWKNFKKYNKGMGKKLEVDLLLLDDDVAIIAEVKINCTKKEIDHFIDQMKLFKEICPEYADKKIFLAVAGVNFERDSDLYAHQRGLFVIRVSNDDIFTLDPSEGDVLTTL